MKSTRPNPIPHLIAAVAELSFALRDLDAARPDVVVHGPISQDGEEYVDEIAALTALILTRLREENGT
ncbi:hypothetical protein [Herbiconiux ginsengi]|uniref:Uncharacterized protein n=1 Tax=Herbiconiux ginsengi TaxID=381665 RepID=A0A1H3S117_9MICO|nr:hypothetical protein [Herbiconiux ginsengi]SDZ31477.1 hypothetical protein SAMN05216554_3217 [Herbiconiux ginsengi]